MDLTTCTWLKNDPVGSSFTGLDFSNKDEMAGVPVREN